MKYDRFIDEVSQRAGVSREQAERFTRATLETLAERIPAKEVKDLAAELPEQLREWLVARPVPERFGLDEFVGRVSERAGTSVPEAREGARAVLTTVREAVVGGEFRDVMEQLPDEYWEVVEPTSWRGGPSPVHR